MIERRPGRPTMSLQDADHGLGVKLLRATRVLGSCGLVLFGCSCTVAEVSVKPCDATAAKPIPTFIDGIRPAMLALNDDGELLAAGVDDSHARAVIGGVAADRTRFVWEATGYSMYFAATSVTPAPGGWLFADPVETLADTVADLRARGVVWPRA